MTENLCFIMTTSKLETGIYYTKDGLGVLLTFEEFNVKYGLNTNFLTNSSSGTEVTIHKAWILMLKALNMRKSLTITYSVR